MQRNLLADPWTLSTDDRKPLEMFPIPTFIEILSTIICKELVPRQQFVRLIGEFDLEILVFLMLHLPNVHVLQTH